VIATVKDLMMRVGFAVALILACAPGTSGASPAAANAANTRGIRLLKQKDYRGAIAQFKKAIAEDKTHVLAHYNLACAASLAQDMDTAFAELVWVGNRAGWDDQARAAALKAAKDPDLKWVIDTNPDAVEWVGPDVAMLVVDVLAADKARTAGRALTDADKDSAMTALSTGTRTRDDSCDPADPKQSAVLGLSFDAHAGGKHTAVVSLATGIALLDAKGKVVARSQPLGCTGPGASQDRLTSLAYLSAAPRGEPNAAAASSALASEMFIVKYGNGGRTDWSNNVAVFMRRDKQLVRTFEATIERSDATGTAQLSMTALGDLVLVAPGDKRKQVFHWDQKAFRFAAE
jgi:hypothetical protein